MVEPGIKDRDKGQRRWKDSRSVFLKERKRERERDRKREAHREKQASVELEDNPSI